MFSRASVVTLLLTISFSLPTNAQYSALITGPNRMNVQDGSVSGTVFDSQGQPVARARVELQDANSLVMVEAAYTLQNGSFELYNIPAGQYQVVAQLGTLQAKDTVSVRFGQSNVDLRLPPDPAVGAGYTVSVGEMLIPRKARSAYAKAREACAKGKFDSAQKLLDQALGIEPHFAAALTLRGLLEQRDNHNEQSRRDLDQAIQFDPNYGMAYLALGAVYNSQARYDDALRTLEHGLAVSPASWQTYFEMAKASIGKGMYDQGLQYADKAENMSGNNFAAVHLLKAYAMIPLKLYRAAKQELQAYTSHEPKGQKTDQAQRLLAQLDAQEAASLAKGK